MRARRISRRSLYWKLRRVLRRSLRDYGGIYGGTSPPESKSGGIAGWLTCSSSFETGICYPPCPDEHKTSSGSVGESRWRAMDIFSPSNNQVLLLRHGRAAARVSN